MVLQRKEKAEFTFVKIISDDMYLEFLSPVRGKLKAPQTPILLVIGFARCVARLQLSDLYNGETYTLMFL